MRTFINKATKLTAVALVLSMFTGCAAMHTAVKKRNLDVQTKMSETVFLDPVSADKRTVFLQLRNTSDKQDFKLDNQITAAIQNKGYTVVQDPDKAHYWIQANILKVGKSDLREQQNMLAGGYGSAIAGAAVGAQFGSNSGQIGMGLIGAGIGLIGDAMVDDTYFLMTTDLQISEKAKKSVVVTEKNNAALKQGTSGHKTVTSTETVNRKKFQTRIVSSANKVNLDFAEAQPHLVNGLVNSISGLL